MALEPYADSLPQLTFFLTDKLTTTISSDDRNTLASFIGIFSKVNNFYTSHSGHIHPAVERAYQHLIYMLSRALDHHFPLAVRVHGDWYLPECTDSSHQKHLLRAGDSDILLQPTFWVSEEQFAELQAQVYSTSSASASRRCEAAKPTSSKPNKSAPSAPTKPRVSTTRPALKAPDAPSKTAGAASRPDPSPAASPPPGSPSAAAPKGKAHQVSPIVASSTAVAARPGQIMSSRPPPKAPLPHRNPPRVSHRESSAHPSKKHAVKADSESETVPDNPATSGTEEPSEASEEEPSPKNTDDRDYIDHPDSSMCAAPANRVLIADSDVEMKTAAPSKKKKALSASATAEKHSAHLATQGGAPYDSLDRQKAGLTMSIIEGMQAPGHCFNCTLVFQKTPFRSCVCEFNGWGMPCTRCHSHGHPGCTFALPIPGLVETITSLQGWCQVQPNLLPEILDDAQQAGLEALHLQNLALAKGRRAALLMQRACTVAAHQKRTLSLRILELQSPDFLASLNWLLDLSPEILDTYLPCTKGIESHNAMFGELLLTDANLPSSSLIPLPQQEIRIRVPPPRPIPSWAIPSTSTAPPLVFQPTTRTVSIIRADASGEFSLHPATFPSWGSERAPVSTASREPPRISRCDSVFLEAPHVASTTEDSPVIVVDPHQSPAPVGNFAPSKDTAHDGDVSMGDTLLVDNSLADTLMADSTTAPTVVDTPAPVVQSAPSDPVDSGKSTTTAAADLFDPEVVVTTAANVSVVYDLTNPDVVIPSPTPKLCDIDLDAQLSSDKDADHI
ncbi:hypothetical protein HYPSUDRAFT_208980 [Hypholoma sublateritium FD-334 SS-4]|uniref:Uncharacterized protein n=1 Tax=Hypholoma sublateritium (strain FD-334 SS-4) TaxID=945553 RepID=A0A0D2NC12_HYPSF|nr:hypothetical protein HYPSUDRAFT_208980 [Hypholoma sublateritium FD-334 SS-4]